jgi:TolB-like protein/Flp pilus assembly protein TadD
MQRVWPGLIVSPETISQRAKLVRDALDDDSQSPRYIGGVRGRGYRLLSPVSPLSMDSETAGGPNSAEAPLKTQSRVRWLTATTIGAAVLLAVGLALIPYLRERRSDAPASTTGRTSVVVEPYRSIAVLPFVNMSGDPENEYFSDGLSEELLDRLTVIPELHVAARTSSFHFKGNAEDVKKIGQLLGVRHVLEGSVRKQGDRIRITAQLVSTEDGYRVWSNTFDRRLVDVFAVQDEIALALADNLKLTLVEETRAALVHHSTSNPQALDLYLRARHLYQSWDLDRIDKAIGYFKEAIRLDPTYVDAYVAQADALFARSQSTLECCNPEGAWAQPRRALLRRALELDPRHADAIASVGFDLMISTDFAGAERELHRAEALNPNSELVLRFLSFYYTSNGWPPEKAIEYANRLFRLDPLNPLAATDLAAAYYNTNHYAEALAATDKAIELDPNYWFAYWIREATLLDLGRPAEALEATRRTLALAHDYGDAYSDLIRAYADLGQMEQAQRIFREIDAPGRKPRWRNAFRAYALASLHEYDRATAALEDAYREHEGIVPEALGWKVFIPLHDKPRFKRLVHLLGVERRIQQTRDMNHIPTRSAAAN